MILLVKLVSECNLDSTGADERVICIVGCWKICGVPWYDHGDNKRGWPLGTPQQAHRRDSADRHIPSW